MSDQTVPRQLRARGLVLALGLAGAGVLVAPAGPASAAVPGLVRIAVTSASNSNDFRTATATCPLGKVLVGTGFELNGATGEAVVDDLRPNGGPAVAPTSVTVGAYEADPFAGNWSLTAYAVCANPLPGLVRITAVSTTDSNDFHGVTAACPLGKVLTGTGYELNGSTGEAVVDDFLPSGGAFTAPTAVTVGAFEADSFAGNWSATGYAICANPVPGLIRVGVNDVSSSNDFHAVTAPCPAGKVLTGAGYQVNGATGEAVVDDFRPNGGAANAPTSVFVGTYEEDGFAGNWTNTSFAICADR